MILARHGSGFSCATIKRTLDYEWGVSVSGHKLDVERLGSGRSDLTEHVSPLLVGPGDSYDVRGCHIVCTRAGWVFGIENWIAVPAGGVTPIAGRFECRSG